jgi:hypothetical protein
MKNQNPVVYPQLHDSIIQQQTQLTATGSFNQEQIQLLSTLPFWINDSTEHANIYDDDPDICCYNHYVGLPEKDGERLPLFDYQVHEQYRGQPGIIYAFEHYDAVYVLKATGIGFSDISLRWMCHKAHTGSPRQYRNSEMVIVTGPRHELATKQINRIRNMYYDRLGILFHTDQYRVTLPPNNVTIQSYPSHNVDSFRGIPKVSIVLIDEGDFFPPGQQQAVRDAAERYLGKSKAKIILGSTPYNPGGLMEKIQREEKSLYKRLYLNYEVGLNKIFTPEDIEKARQSPSFEREYNLRYAYDIGNVLTEQLIQRCLDIKYSPDHIVYECPKAIGIDPSYGSSKFAIVVTQFMDGRIQVLFAEEFDRPDPFEMERLSLDLSRKYGLFEGTQQNGQLLVDGANVNFIKSMKHMLNENIHYEDEKPEDHIYKRVRPINFGTTHRQLLSNMIELVAKGYVAIDPKFENLLNQLRVAQMDANLSLIKKPLTLDLVDAFRLSLFGFQIR